LISLTPLITPLLSVLRLHDIYYIYCRFCICILIAVSAAILRHFRYFAGHYACLHDFFIAASFFADCRALCFRHAAFTFHFAAMLVTPCCHCFRHYAALRHAGFRDEAYAMMPRCHFDGEVISFMPPRAAYAVARLLISSRHLMPLSTPPSSPCRRLRHYFSERARLPPYATSADAAILLR